MHYSASSGDLGWTFCTTSKLSRLTRNQFPCVPTPCNITKTDRRTVITLTILCILPTGNVAGLSASKMCLFPHATYEQRTVMRRWHREELGAGFLVFGFCFLFCRNQLWRITWFPLFLQLSNFSGRDPLLHCLLSVQTGWENQCKHNGDKASHTHAHIPWMYVFKYPLVGFYFSNSPCFS